MAGWMVAGRAVSPAGFGRRVRPLVNEHRFSSHGGAAPIRSRGLGRTRKLGREHTKRTYFYLGGTT